jgi:hypothetical protein
MPTSDSRGSMPRVTKKMRHPLPIPSTHFPMTKVQLFVDFPGITTVVVLAALVNQRIGGGLPKGLLPIFSVMRVGRTGVNMRTLMSVQFAKTLCHLVRKARRNVRGHLSMDPARNG